MGKLIVILLISLIFEAVGVVLLDKGLHEIGEVQRISVAEILRLISRGFANPSILLGVFFELIFFIGLLIMLSRWDVSLVWPLTSLGFVLTTLAAVFIRHEQVSALRWSGVVLIMLGASLVGWSEKHKQLKPAEASASGRAQLSKEPPRSQR